MAQKFLPSLAAAAFATILFRFFPRRGDRARSTEESAKRRRVCGNDGTAGGASSTHASTEGQEVATSSGYDYEVFLSFRGPDTRSGFTDYLYTSLTDAGIRTFKDDEELRIGQEFAPELLEAINQSRISIPIFSKGYASSIWCLKELVQMVKHQKNKKQKIMPIFYDVTPSEIRRQTGSFKNAFVSHKRKRRYDEKTIREWKDALIAAADINGWDLQSMPNRQEGQFAKTIVRKVFNELKKSYLVVSNCLVNVDNQVDKIMEKIGAWTGETRIIGILGMGGIGKTTIAKIIYNQLSNNFKYCCFLSNICGTIKLKGIEFLQHQLISDILKMKWTDIRNIDEGIETFKDMLSNKKVLLLLDDVDHKEHMDALVGKRDRFGEGTKIIITTRNKEVLKVPEVDDYYEVDIMDPLQSLRLFSKHAFRRDYPLAEYMDETIKAIKITGGLPLALEVIGSLLSCTEKERWNDKLMKLKDVPPKELMRQLRISYDALEVHERHIFLDIACFFIGSYKFDLVYFWESKFHPEDALNVLENMSLIKIKEDNEVWMHDQLRDLGRQIIRQESTMKIEEQCRVWDPEEALDLLKRHERKKKVEALRLHLGHQHHFTYKDFKRLPYLRFLEVYGSKETFHAEERLFLHESPSNFVPTNVFRENSNLLPRLRWLSWNDIPPTFNITNFSMEDVVILDLSRSEITHDWKGWSHMKVMKNLKILNLSYCQRLKRNPNFSAHSNLKRLNLSDCKSLIEIDRSICHLIRLVSLDVSNCRDLRRLPEELGGNLARLKYLSLNYCKSLEKLPDSIGNLESLIELHISSTGIRELPDSIINLRTLKVVKMWHSVMSKISKALWTIEKLEEIEFHKSIRPGIHVKIGDCIYRNQSLRILKLVDMEINALPVLPKGLIELELSCLDMDMDMFPDLSNLTNLKVLDLWFGPPNYEGISNGLAEVSIPWWIGNLSKLESLDLGSPDVTTSPTDLTLPLHLKSLLLFCPNLRRLPRLPSSLSSLSLQHCKSLCSMEDLSNLKKLSFLEIDDAAITEVQGLGCLENLRDLRFIGLQQVKILSALTNLNKLMRIRVGCCGNLVEIEGELPESLENLEIDSCKSLQKLPDLSSLNGLREVRIHRCEKLNVEAISRLCSEKSIMFRQSRF